MASWQPPEEFDGYRLERLLGRGGMGEVHLAIDSLLERQVAIKFISAPQVDRQARERFLIEARAVARLQHPNVVTVYRIGEVHGYPYLVSEFVPGTSLNRLLKRLSTVQLLRLAQDLAGALAAAHRRGIIHRDIKPANVILSTDGVAKLLDFGIAKLVPTMKAAEPAGTDPDQDGPDATPATTPAAKPAPADPDATPITAPATEPAPADPDATPATMPKPESAPADPDVTPAELVTPGPAPAAHDLTEAGMLMGSPRYMAPELWTGARATFRSDLYSFGALLYALAAGHPPHRSKDPAELMRLVVASDPPPLSEAAPEVPAALAAVVGRCLRRDPEQRFADGNEVRAALARLDEPGAEQIAPQGNPYRGLSAFEAEHSRLFFGRDSEIRMILQRLSGEPFVLVVGDSGVGKSSLCRAGVLPRIDAWLGDDRRWSVLRLVPGPHPVAAMTSAIGELTGRDESELARLMRDDPGGLARAIRASLGPERGLVLFIDQLEELLTLADPGERDAAAGFIVWMGDPTPGLRLLATVRGDFLSRLANLPPFGNRLARSLYFLRPLTPERLRDAVVGPAATQQVRFESDAMVEALIGAVAGNEAGLPLLQFALAELWEARTRPDVIQAADLESIGGVTGALTRHADQVLAGMLPGQRALARELLLGLVHPDGTRARRTEAELCAGREGHRTAIEVLVRGRLLVAQEHEGETSYTIAHEALVQGWATLAAWRSAEGESRLKRERLRAATREWERMGRPADQLWTGRQLSEGAALDRSRLTQVEVDFLTASRRRLRRRRVLKVAAWLALPLLALGTWAGVGIAERLQTDAQIEANLERVAPRLRRAQDLERAAETLRAEALALFDGRRAEAGEERWAAFKTKAGEATGELEGASRELELTLLMDPERVEVRRRFVKVLDDRARLAALMNLAAQRRSLLARMELYPEGRALLQRLRAPARVELELRPADTPVKLEQYRADEAGRLRAHPLDPPPGFPGRFDLPPGSYRLVVSSREHAPVYLPFDLAPTERRTLRLDLPPPERIPPGFALVPAGRFLFGSAAADDQRQEFFHTVPRHALDGDSFLIAIHETTFGDWLTYLEALPADERSAATPKVGQGGFQGAVGLTRQADGRWRLHLRPAGQVFKPLAGEPIVYPGRDRATTQDWLKVPVVGISAAQAQGYCDWLDATGRVPGARLCTELEWEHAARGADGRAYPHGHSLRPDEANHDATYDRDPAGMGPDQVGSHPASVSPFGLHDMAGNVWEWTRSSLAEDELVARGGSFYFGANSCKTTDREVTEPAFRDVSVGFRVCASLSAPKPSKGGRSAPTRQH